MLWKIISALSQPLTVQYFTKFYRDVAIFKTFYKHIAGVSSCSEFTSKMESRAGGPPTSASATRKSQLNRSLSNSDVAGYEKNDGSISDSAVSSSVTEGRKRRPSLGYKVAALVGLSRKSNSTSQLAGQGESDYIDGNEAYQGHVTYDVRGHGGQSSPYGRRHRAEQGVRGSSRSYNDRLRSEGGLARGRGRADVEYRDRQSSRSRGGRRYDDVYPQSHEGRTVERDRRGRSADRAELYLQGQGRHGRDGRPGMLRQNSADSAATSGYGSMYAPEDQMQRPASARGSYAMGQGHGSYQGHDQMRPDDIGFAQGQGQSQQVTFASQGQAGYYENQGNFYSQDQFQGQNRGRAGYNVQGQIQGQNGQTGAYSNQGQFQGQGHSNQGQFQGQGNPMAYPNQGQSTQPNQTRAIIHAQPNQMAAQTPTGVVKKSGGNIIMPLAATPTKRAPMVISPAAVDQNSLFATLGPRPASATPTTPSKSSSFGRLSEMVSSPSALFSKAKESSDGQSTGEGSNLMEMGTGLLNKGLASFKSFF